MWNKDPNNSWGFLANFFVIAVLKISVILLEFPTFVGVFTWGYRALIFHSSLDATEHNCRTYIQRPVSVSNFPLGYHGLHQFQTQFGQSQNFQRFKVRSCFYWTILTSKFTGQIYRHFYFLENFTEHIYLYFSRLRILPGLFL